jgi:GNAT superfamily N-acetyltransferase
VEQMKEEQDFFECFIAETKDGEVVWVAFYFLAYYTWVGKSLYLDDLYIKESFRRNWIWSKLLEKIFEVAKKENCKRVRWQVLHWNKPAVELYKKLGAEIDSEFHNCDFDYKWIQQFKI